MPIKGTIHLRSHSIPLSMEEVQSYRNSQTDIYQPLRYLHITSRMPEITFTIHVYRKLQSKEKNVKQKQNTKQMQSILTKSECSLSLQ